MDFRVTLNVVKIPFYFSSKRFSNLCNQRFAQFWAVLMRVWGFSWLVLSVEFNSIWLLLTYLVAQVSMTHLCLRVTTWTKGLFWTTTIIFWKLQKVKTWKILPRICRNSLISPLVFVIYVSWESLGDNTLFGCFWRCWFVKANPNSKSLSF